MKYSLLMAALLFGLSATAQRERVDALLNAEKSFAAYSVEHGMKEAFPAFLDSSGIVFDNGKAVNGIALWQKRPKTDGVLNWQPVYAHVSASGDPGFTTGPWTFQPKTAKDSIAARGRYSTLWKKDKKGQWKAVVDLGNTRTPPFEDAAYGFKDEAIRFVPGTWNDRLNTERQFISLTQYADPAERKRQYEKVLSKGAFFQNRNGRLPAVEPAEAAKALQTMPQKIDYAIDGSGISSGGDLGYVYGSSTINNNSENYLRIWRREGKEWRLLLEVLRY